MGQSSFRRSFILGSPVQYLGSRNRTITPCVSHPAPRESHGLLREARSLVAAGPHTTWLFALKICANLKSRRGYSAFETSFLEEPALMAFTHPSIVSSSLIFI